MNGINRVFLMGYLGADPEVQTSRNGKTYLKLRLATHYGKRMDPDRREQTTVWHRVTVWGRSADKCREFLHKGSPVAVEGYLSRYSYEREDGTEVGQTGVVAREIHFISSRRTPDSLFAPLTSAAATGLGSGSESMSGIDAESD